jgi:membrane fusion protein (multidrug efflux system)
MGCNRHQAPPAPPAPEVAVVTVKTERVVLTSELPGRTSGLRVAEIKPQVNGLLLKRFFAEGATVKAGEKLYQIDPAPYQAALDIATAKRDSAKEAADRARAALQASIAAIKSNEATLTLAKTNYKRYEKLVKTQAASAMDFDKSATEVEKADSALRVAKAQVETDQQSVEAADAAIKEAETAIKKAKIDLAYCEITAPISGRIGRSNITEGAIVTAYQPTPLATIQQIDPIFVDVPQSTVELNRLKRSLANGGLKENGTDEVKIVLEDGTPYPQKGSLKFRDVTVDPTTGSVILRVVVPNPDSTLLPGMFVRAIIDEGANENAILVPQQSVSRDPKGNPLVLLVKGKPGEEKVETQSITTERAIGDKWLVSTGLSVGDRVVIEGLQKARPGTPVKIATQKAGDPNAPKSKETVHTATSLKRQ